MQGLDDDVEEDERPMRACQRFSAAAKVEQLDLLAALSKCFN